MSDGLKPGWRRWRFEQMAQNVNKRIDDPSQAGVEYYVGLEHLDSDSLKIRRWGSPDDVSATKLLFEPGDIIFGRRRAYQRKLGVAEFRGIASAHSLVLRAKPAVVLPEFLPFFMQSDLFMERAQRISVGSLSPTINWKTLAKEEFALPPLEEQRRCISTFEVSAKHLEEIQKLITLAESLSLSATNFYVDQWINEGTVELGSILRGAPESGCSAPESSGNTGHWVLALSALSRSGYVSGELKAVEPTQYMLAASLSPGDLLISRSNTLDRVGFVGRYQAESHSAISFPDTMMRLLPKPELMETAALEMILQSSNLRSQIMSIAAGTSASMKKINKTNLMKIRVPTPSKAQQKLAINHRKEIADALHQAKKRAEAAWIIHNKVICEALRA